MTSRLARLLLALTVGLVGALASSAVAQAAAGSVKLSFTGTFTQVEYTGTSDANVVGFGGSLAERSVTITEVGIADPPQANDPENLCDLTGPITLTCRNPSAPAQYDPKGVAYMRAGSDVTTGTGTQRWKIYGEAGDDSLTGSDQAEDLLSGGENDDELDGRGDSGGTIFWESLYGDAGNDILRGGAGDEGLDGGFGDDDLDAGAGDDQLAGGKGVDTLRAGPGDDSLNAGESEGELSEGGDGSDHVACTGDSNEVYDGGPGFDSIVCYGGVDGGVKWDPDDYLIDLAAGIVRRTNHVPTLSTLRSAEDVQTRDGNDVLIGTDGSNSLQAGAGDDLVDGRGGSDHLWGGRGDDALQTNDGVADRADGGPDGDTCRSDQLDELFACETLTLAPMPTPTTGPTAGADAVDSSGPACRVSRSRGSLAKARITFTATCNETVSLAAEAVGRLRRLPRGVLASRVGDLTLGSTTARLTASGTVRVTLRLSRRYRRALPKRARIRVDVRATDALGNQSTVTRTVRMR